MMIGHEPIRHSKVERRNFGDHLGMKRLIVSLAMFVGVLSPAMAQDLFSTLFGSPPPQIEPARPTVYGRAIHHIGTAIFGPMSGMVEATANRYGVPPALVHAVARKESGERCLRGRGIMQVNPRTAASMGIRGHSCPENLAAGVLYLKQAIAMHGWGCSAFSAYQSGLGVHRCTAYGRSIMAMMHGGSSARVRVASVHRHHYAHYAMHYHRVHYASYYHHHRHYASL